MHSSPLATQKEHGATLAHLIFRCRHCVHAVGRRLKIVHVQCQICAF